MQTVRQGIELPDRIGEVTVSGSGLSASTHTDKARSSTHCPAFAGKPTLLEVGADALAQVTTEAALIALQSSPSIFRKRFPVVSEAMAASVSCAAMRFRRGLVKALSGIGNAA